MKTTIMSVIAAAVLAPFMMASAAPVDAAITFKMSPNVKIHAADNSAIGLADLKVGEKVGIAYQENNGVAVAEKIHVIAPTNVEPAKGQPGKAPANPDPFIHAHGVITHVNAAEGTLTADVRVAPKKR